MLRADGVYQDSETTGQIAYYFFRDGIKWISFRKGLTVEELKGFLLVLNQYRTIQEDPEGDLATALWESNFDHIGYQASNIYWESEPEVDLHLPVAGESPPVLEDKPEQVQQISLIQGYLNSSGDLYQLTPSETARLQEMIIEEEKRDSAQDLLDLASILLKDRGNNDLLEALFQFIKTEIDKALTRGNLESACKTLRTVHTIRSAAKTEGPWAIPHFNRLVISISGSENLTSLSSVLRDIQKSDGDRFKLLGQFILMLHSNALRSLAPMIGHIRSMSLQKRYIKILEVMASRNLALLEKLLASEDENLVHWLVYITGRLPGKKPEELVWEMTRSGSAKVRKQAIKCLLAREPALLKPLFPMIEDTSEDVRQVILGHLMRHRNTIGEKLLLEYLQKDDIAVNGEQHIIDCYRALGKCGSASSIPFLEEVLFKGRWHQVFNGSDHRQGAVTALAALNTPEAQKLLSKASRSFSPSVRMAYKRGKEASPC